MLDSLDDRSFADLEDAYGPAVDVPGQLRALASDDLEQARAALEDLRAGIFHQDSYYSAAAPSVPFLLELAAAQIPARADVLLFLADMSGTVGDPELACQPYLFRSTPGLPDYPEAVATIEAIAAGREIFVAALGSDNAEVRACAAYSLAQLGDSALVDPLLNALNSERDPNARMALHFALARLGCGPRARESGLVGDVVDTLSFERDRERGLAAIGRLLRLEGSIARESMPFFDGDLVRFASVVLVEQGGDDPRAFSVAEQALADRLARGEAIRELPPPASTRICDELDGPVMVSFAEYLADVPLRTIAGAMSALAFGERARDQGLLVREQLDERMRRVLALTRDHAIPVAVAGAPWIEPSTMARFLAGGGPLDELFEWQGEPRPLFVIMTELTRLRDKAKAELEADRLFAELARAWTPEELIALTIDILDDGYALARYGQPAPAIHSALAKHVEPLALAHPALLSDYAERLLEREHVTGAQARFALMCQIAGARAVEERLDRLARAAMVADKQAGLVWLASFPEPRRSRMVAALGNAYLRECFASVCDPATLETELIAAFLDPACAWFTHEAEPLLATVEDTSRLQELHARTKGRRQAVLARVIQARTRAGVFVLEMLVDGDAIRATLFDGVGELIAERPLSSSPRVDELAELIDRCSSSEFEPTIELVGDIDSTTSYRVMRLLGDAGFRGRVISGGTTMSAGAQ